MKEYRITKYNPQNRTNGKYIIDEWSSISDVGKKFDAGILTRRQYKTVENAYIECCLELLRVAGVSEILVVAFECYDGISSFPRLLCNESDMRQIIVCCLQERCWAKLEADDFFIHFGYDYYMYIGTSIPRVVVEKMVKHHKLFCEEYPSPY